jgi:hypothetical protein
MSTRSEIKDFISNSFALRESALLYVKTETNIPLALRELGLFDFEKAETLENLAELSEKGTKAFFVITKETIKESYDFLRQYPLGAIDIFDRKTSLQSTFIPEYSKNIIIFVTSKEMIEFAEGEGFELLKVSGGAYELI